MASDYARGPAEVDLARGLWAAERRLLDLIGVIVAVAEVASGQDDEAAFHEEHREGRLGAIRRAQAVVRSRRGLIDLHSLLVDELIAHAAFEERHFSIEGPDVRLTGSALGEVWLAMHELAVNSVKFGALSAQDGLVAVDWRIEAGGPTRLQLRWVERKGPSAPPVRRHGFGTEMIERRLARELGGSGALGFPAAGLECRISLPVGAEIMAAPGR